jgi:hypothetical protein
MRKLINSLVLISIFTSCSSPIEKKYTKEKFPKDLTALKKSITEDDLNILTEYISSRSYSNENIGISYKYLLYIAKKKNEEKIERQEKDKKKIIIQNINQILNDRIERHNCDDFINVITGEENFQHKEDEIDAGFWEYNSVVEQ